MTEGVFILSGTATAEGSVEAHSADLSMQSTEKFFSPSFFSCLDWIS